MPSEERPTPTVVEPAAAARIDLAAFTHDCLVVYGWAIGLTEPLASVSLTAGEQAIELKDASLPVPRPDVSQHFHAGGDAGDNHGFLLMRELAGLSPVASSVRLRVETDSGRSETTDWPLKRDEEAMRAIRETGEPSWVPLVPSLGPEQIAVLTRLRSPLVPRSEPPTIHLECDHASLTRTGEVCVTGWAFATSGDAEVRVLLDDRDLGPATERIPREDVATTHASMPHAALSGFVFRRALGHPIEGRHALTLLVSSPGAPTRALYLPVFAMVPSLVVQQTPRPPATLESPFKCEIDMPALSGKEAREAIRGSLIIKGWALARAGVSGVEVLLDGSKVGSAYFGIHREDVAAAFPSWNGSSNCGFGISVPPKTLKPGKHAVCVRVHDREDCSSDFEFTVQIDASGSELPAESLCRRMPLARLRLNRQVLAALGWAPCFHLVLDLRRREVDLKALTVTLADLSEQVYDDWQLSVLLTPGSESHEDIAGVLAGEVGLARRTTILAWGEDTWPAPHCPLGASEQPVWTGPLQPGDRLGCDALLEFAVATGLHPGADFVYSDERRRDPATGNARAFFKPGWSPSLLLSTNYIGRLWLACETVLRGLDRASGGALEHGEYDLVLRLTAASARVAHVPLVLCERAAPEIDVAEVEHAALRRAAQARGIAGRIEAGPLAGVYRLRRSLQKPGLVSIIVPTRGAGGHIRKCIETLRLHTGYRNFEIVCIENIPDSDPDAQQWVRANAERVVRAEGAFNWSRFNNVAVQAASADSDYYLFLNDDVEIIEPGWLEALLEHGQLDDVGIVGALLLYPNGSIQHAGMFMPEAGAGRHAFRFADPDEPGPFGLAQVQREVIGVTGACMLVRREVFERLGRFDETHNIVNNDLDFCLRCIDHGLRVVYTPYARLVHHEMASRGSQRDDYDEQGFQRAWGLRFAGGDPYYHPALSRQREDFSPDLEPVAVVQADRASREVAQIRRILAIKLDHIGDFITAFPAFRRIKQRFPSARLYVLASSAAITIAKLEPSIDEVIEFNFFNARSSLGRLELSEADLHALRFRLEPYRFDLAIDLRKHAETRPLLRYTAAMLTAGYDHDGEFPWLDVALEWESDAPLLPKRRHVSTDLVGLVDTVATHFDGGAPALTRMDVEAVGTAGPNNDTWPKGLFDRPVICVHPGSGNALRTWPSGHFVQLIKLLLQARDVTVALIGGSDERRLAESVAAAVTRPDSVYSLVGSIPLDQLPAFIARCALFVGNNSGPQHLAAALGVPTVGIHSGVVDAQEWAPVGPTAVAIRREMSCSPCYFSEAEQCPRQAACLTELLPGHVLDTCLKLLAVSAPGSAAPRDPLTRPPSKC